MRRQPFVVVLAAGFVVLLVAGLVRSSALVYSTRSIPQGAVTPLTAGRQACRPPVTLPDGARFARVRMFARPVMGELGVSILAGKTVVGSSSTEAGTMPARGPAVLVAGIGSVDADRPLGVCAAALPGGSATLWGTRTREGVLASDFAVRFERSSPRPLLTVAPAMAERASVFNARWVSPATLLLLALLIVVGLPVLLARALRA